MFIRFHSAVATLLLLGNLLGTAAEPDQKAEEPAKKPVSRAQRAEVDQVVRDAFRSVHDGWSADEVVLQDELNAKFLAACRQSLPDAKAADLNWSLLNLRKSGKLDVKSTRRARDDHDEYDHAAEIAARYMYDKHQLTIDRVVCDPEKKAEFDQVAQAAAPDVSAYRLRKAAIGLRKARKLQPELVVRVADWKKEVTSHTGEQLVKAPQLIPEKPGIYIFRDATGYLYVGESQNLRQRVTKHLDHSDRKSLARYLWEKGNKEITVELHAFDPYSGAKLVTARRAYESELIRSRHPRFNLAP